MAHGVRVVDARFADNPWGRGQITIRHIEKRPPLLGFFWMAINTHSADGNLAPVIDWVKRYLHIGKLAALRWLRKQWLLRRPMPGIRTGGHLGMTDRLLSSRYVQLLLHTLQAMKSAQMYDFALVQAARRSGLPMLVDAAEALTPPRQDDP